MCDPWADECKLAYMANGNSITSAIQRYKDLQSAKEAAERAVKPHSADDDLADIDAAFLANDVFYLVGDAFGNGIDVHTVSNDDMQVNINRVDIAGYIDAFIGVMLL